MSTIGSFLCWRVFELNRKILFHRNIRTQPGDNEFVIKGLSYITALFSESAMCLKLQPGWAKSSSPYNKYKYILITKHSQVFLRHVNLQIY